MQSTRPLHLSWGWPFKWLTVLLRLSKAYQQLHGKWGYYTVNRGGREHIVGFEVDTDYYRTIGVTDTIESNIEPEENIIDW